MHSVGVRLGDPTGFMYKSYLNYRGEKGTAWEVGIGLAPNGWNKGYYRRSFNDRNNYDGYTYNSVSVNNAFCLQGRYLFNRQVPVQGVYGRFDWYWGVGAVFKAANVKYFYHSNLPPYQIATDTRTDIDFGPEVILGAEYRFDNEPFILFAEFGLFTEVADRVGVQGLIGTGARYVF